MRTAGFVEEQEAKKMCGSQAVFEPISLEKASKSRSRLYRGQFSPKPGGWLANAAQLVEEGELWSPKAFHLRPLTCG